MSYIISKINGYDIIPTDPTEIDNIVSSSTEMNKIVNSILWMSAITNNDIWMNKICNSDIAMDKITKSEMAMNCIASSVVAVNNIIKSATALYYICINNSYGKGLEKLANNIVGGMTINWENSKNWQTLYDTLNNASNLFNASYINDHCNGCTKNRQGDLITLITHAKVSSQDAHKMSITPRYYGCYSHSYTNGWSTYEHIMWGGHESHHRYETATSDNDVYFYMFTPIT